MQGIHNHLLTGPTTPFKFIVGNFYQQLSPDVLQDIAGEDILVLRKWQQLKKEIEYLKLARKTFRWKSKVLGIDAIISRPQFSRLKHELHQE
ncbi:hypothetical protein DIZ76_016853 [Coccidioides immitis]|nr:hypothetical protein DIZ76_016853 [Coccidioides immitis]